MIRTLGLGAPPFLTNHFAQGQPEILLGRWVMRVIFLIVPCCSHHSHKWLCASPIYPHKIRFIFLILVGLYSLFLHYQESVCSKFLLFLPKHPDCETKWKRGKGKNFQKKHINIPISDAISISPIPRRNHLLSVGFQESSCSMWESESERSHLQDVVHDAVHDAGTIPWIPWIHDSIGDKCSRGSRFVYCHCIGFYHYCILLS